MSNIHHSLTLAKDSEELIYFVEDDYLHKENTKEEMIFTYEKLSTILKDELFVGNIFISNKFTYSANIPP